MSVSKLKLIKVTWYFLCQKVEEIFSFFFSIFILPYTLVKLYKEEEEFRTFCLGFVSSCIVILTVLFLIPSFLGFIWYLLHSIGLNFYPVLTDRGRDIITGSLAYYYTIGLYTFVGSILSVILSLFLYFIIIKEAFIPWIASNWHKAVERVDIENKHKEDIKDVVGIPTSKPPVKKKKKKEK
jgi:hypothetical protein